MESSSILKKLPEVKKEDLYHFFPRINHSDYPQLLHYTWEECHMGSLGAGDLYLASELAEKMVLKPGMRMLELGAGHVLSSIFFAREYGIQVFAIDYGTSPTENWARAVNADVGDMVFPMDVDVRHLPFPECYFDCIFSMNSYFYFGTDDLFLSYLCNYLKTGGSLGIASPCYACEFDKTIPKHLLYDPPEYKESLSCHSPAWWRNHLEKANLLEIIECQEHPKGREFWLDSIRWQLESGRKLTEVQNDIKMLLLDKERMITYFSLIGKKKDLGVVKI